MDQRSELLASLRYLNDLLRHIDDRWRQRAAIEQRYELLMPLKQPWGRAKLLPVSAAIAAGLILMAVVIGTPVLQARVNAEAQYQGQMFVPVIEPFRVFIMATPVALVLGLPLAWVTIRLRNRRVPRANKVIHQANLEREERNADTYVQHVRVDAELTAASSAFQGLRVYDWYPQRYLYEEALTFCIGMVQDHRAHTVADALNLYEETLHRQRVENAQLALVAEQRKLQRLQIVSTAISTSMQASQLAATRDAAQAARRAEAAASAPGPCVWRSARRTPGGCSSP